MSNWAKTAAIAIILIIIAVAGAYLYTAKQQPANEAVTIRAATLQGGISTLDIIESKSLLGGGYKLQVLRLQKTPDIIAALANNETDLAVIPAEMAGRLIEDGSDVRIIAVEMMQNQAILVKDPAIESPSQLEGKLVGAVVASGTYKIFKAYMKVAYGLDVVEGDSPRDGVVTVVNVPPGSILDALNTGQVDAIVIWEPLVSMGLAKGDRILASYTSLWREAGMKGDPVMLVWVARGEFVDKHPGAVKAFLKARDKAVDTWLGDRDETFRILSKLYRIDEAVFNKLYERTKPLLVKGALTEGQAESIREVWWLAWKGGYLEKDPATIPDSVFYHG